MHNHRLTEQRFTLAQWLIMVIILTVGAMVPADANEMYKTLKSAPVSNDLPLGVTGGSGGSGLPSDLRPNLTYPTLNLDRREKRHHQPAKPVNTKAIDKPVAPRTDFEKLVEQTLGQSLPVFGHRLFSDNARGFEPIDQASVPYDFKLGPGDEITIRAWGSIEIDYRATLDRRGAILIPKVGELALAGVRFGELEQHVRAAIGKSYRGFELSVSLGQLRSIRVYVTGFAKSPGSYTVNGLSTLVNVLFHAGGPGPAGNLRRIELHRAGQLHTTIDLYEFLLNGKYDHDLRVMPEDVVHIPALHGEVAIAGAVHRPGIYQLGDTDRLSDLILQAGMTSALAATHKVVLERIDGTGGRTVEEVALAHGGENIKLHNGDLVLVSPVSPEFVNAVTLRGHVAQPLRHQWHDGMRVSDLLPSSDALISPQYWISRNTRNQVMRMSTDRPATRLEVSFPNINWEHAVIERIDPRSLVRQLLPFNLGKAVLERDPGHDLVLQPGDHLTVFSLNDFRTRTAQKPRFVQIEGEVLNAGFYPASATDTIADLVARAGGLSDEAYLFGLELRRVGVKEKQQSRINDSIDQLEQDYYRHLIDRSRNVISGEMTTAIVPEAAAIKGLINALREAEPTGRVVLELNDNPQHIGEIPALVLADGDTLYIPPVPATVEVVGAVFRQGSFIYNHERTGNYIQRAGLLPTADNRSIYVIRPDGSFTIAHRKVRIRPGDTIIVPEKVDRQTAVRRLKDWTQVLYQFGLGAAGLSILDLF